MASSRLRFGWLAASSGSIPPLGGLLMFSGLLFRGSIASLDLRLAALSSLHSPSGGLVAPSALLVRGSVTSLRQHFGCQLMASTSLHLPFGGLVAPSCWHSLGLRSSGVRSGGSMASLGLHLAAALCLHLLLGGLVAPSGSQWGGLMASPAQRSPQQDRSMRQRQEWAGMAANWVACC